MNTSQRLDAHYGNMVAGFDASPFAQPQVAKSSAQLPGAQQNAVSPWAGPEEPQQQQGSGGGGWLSKVASLFAGLF